MKRYLREQFMRAKTLKLTLVLMVALSPLTSVYAGPPISMGSSGVSSGGRTPSSGSETVSPQNHSERYSKCEEYAGSIFREFHGESGGFLALKSAELVNPENQVFKDMVAVSGVDTASANASAEGDVNEEQARQIAAYLEYLLICDATSYTLNAENYRDSENFEMGDSGVSGETTSAMNAGAMQCLNQGDQQQQQQCMAQQAASGQEIKCKHFGPETHDFLACKRIVNFLDGFVIGKQVMGVQQQFRAGSAAIDAQSDLAKKAREEGGLKIADTMGVQRDSLEQQGNLAYEMAAFDAAKAGTLMAMISSFPQPTDLIAECESSYNITRYNTGVQELGVIAKAVATKINPAKADEIEGKINGAISPSNPQEICKRVVASQFGPTKLFVNQEMIETIRGIAVKAGLEAMANGAKGMLLHDQAKMVDEAINEIEEFEPPEFPVAEFPEETASECLVDPNAEGCIGPNTPGFEGFRNGGFNATVGGSANLGDNGLAASLDDDEGTGSSAGANRDLIPNSLGTVEALGNDDNSFEGGLAGAGSIKAGQAAAAGGGGAPAGGGGGAFGGGGSAGGQPGKKKPSGIKNIKIKTKGNGLGVVGGQGRIGASKKKSSNPFAKLLGKNKKGNKSLSFRGPAQVGGKKGSIFQMISNRYSVVNKKDRLLKYEDKNN